MRRILYALIASLVVGIVVFLGYWFRYRSTPSSDAIINTDTNTTGSFPNDNQTGNNPTQSSGIGSSSTSTTISEAFAQNVQFGTVSDRKVANFFVNKDGIIIFVQTDGQIMQTMPDGTLKTLSAAPVPDMVSASFSFDGKKILVLLGSSQRATIFDTTTQSWELLSDSAQGAVWAPTTQSIAYIADSTNGKKQIIQLDVSAKQRNPKTLATLAIEDFYLAWVAPTTIILNGKASAFAATSMWSFDTSKKTLTPVATEELGLAAQWDGNQQAIAFNSGSRNRGGLLTLRDGKGTTLSTFAFLTLPSKCGFGDPLSITSSSPTKNDTVVCAIPRDASSFSKQVLPDSYEQRALFTVDSLFTINLASGNIQTLRDETDDALDVRQIIVKSHKIFFTNRFDNKLYFLGVSTSTSDVVEP